jgi:hypothetical protein
MVTKEILTAATPKSRIAGQYRITPGVSWSPSAPAKGNETLTDETLEKEMPVLMDDELPSPENAETGILYAAKSKHTFAYWTADDAEGDGFFTVMANARAWFGEEAALDAEGIDEWLYVVTDKKEIRRWVPAPGGGFYETVANIRVWDGAHAERPAQGIEGWLYIEQDTRLVFIWDGAKYINISGVVDIQVEAAPSQSKTPLVIEYEEEETKAVAKLSIKNATAADAGVVKPDGSTITIDASGKITGTKITAGTAITISPTSGVGNVTVNNAGVTRINAGTGIS